jgi:hypothetical protein
MQATTKAERLPNMCSAKVFCLPTAENNGIEHPNSNCTFILRARRMGNEATTCPPFNLARVFPSNPLEQQADPLPYADAHKGHCVATTRTMKFLDCAQGDPRAGHA